MAANTSKGITYPTSGDSVAPLETVFATLASTTNTALGAINAGTDITAGILPVARGGTGGATQAAAAAALSVVPLSSYFAAGKNAVINGAFDVWQRASGITSSSATGYFADRWRYVATGGAGKAFTQAQQAFTVPGAAPVAGYEARFFHRTTVTSVGAGGYTYEALEQPIEDVRTYANNVVTLSFWAKADTTRIVTPQLQQYFGTGGTPSATVTTAGTAVSLTASWQRFTQQITVPSLTGKSIGTNENSALILALLYPNNALYTIDIWGVQLEQGSVATPFETASGTNAGELDLCQRYYYRLYSPSATTTFATGMRFSTTVAWGHVRFPVTMRIAPTALETAGTIDVTTTSGLTSTTTFGEANVDGARLICTTTAVAAAGVGVVIRLNTGAYVGFSAEI